LGYGRLKPRVDAFLGSIGSLNSPKRGTHRISSVIDDGFAYRQPYILTPGSPYGYHRLAQLPSCVTPVNTLTAPAWGRALDRPASPRRDPLSRLRTLSTTGLAWAVFRRYGNINPLSIDYACRPRLRSRLTQGGLTWPWNPWSFGGRVSHPSFATHACILTRVASTAGFHRRFTRHTTLSYHSVRLNHEGLSKIRNLQLRWCA
jgi:hypothetical protein